MAFLVGVVKLKLRDSTIYCEIFDMYDWNYKSNCIRVCIRQNTSREQFATKTARALVKTTPPGHFANQTLPVNLLHFCLLQKMACIPHALLSTYHHQKVMQNMSLVALNQLVYIECCTKSFKNHFPIRSLNGTNPTYCWTL